LSCVNEKRIGQYRDKEFSVSHVFVSYARVDQVRVERYVDKLKASGFAIRWDKDLRGQPFDAQIKQWIEEAGAVVAFWSSTAIRRDFVLGELNYANVRKVVNVRIDPIALDSIPLKLNTLDVIDLSTADITWQSDGLLKLVARCAELLGIQVPRQPGPVVQKNSEGEAMPPQAGNSYSVGINYGVVANTINGSVKTGR
jgi:hypothetical protein